MSTEHTNLPISYPHVRVTGYEPPRSYHHMSSTIHEPTRSWHSISRSKQASLLIKTTHQKQRTSTFSPGSAHTPPGKTVLDRLAVPTHRQAPALCQCPCFLVTAWQSSTCRHAHRSTVRSPVKSIAWRVSVYRQAPYQNNTFLVYDTPVNPV